MSSKDFDCMAALFLIGYVCQFFFGIYILNMLEELKKKLDKEE